MLKDWVDKLPKAELHIHIEGSLEPEMMFRLARRNGIELGYRDVQSIRDAYRFDCLQDFLDVYYQGMSVLLTEQDFDDLTWAYLLKCREQNVVHTEIFFDPQGHTERGVPFDTVMRGLCSALDRGRRRLGISSRLILCFLRHLDQESAHATLNSALHWRQRITGVGLDSSERDHPPVKFRGVFRRAADAGFLCVAHAGEEGPPEYVRQALQELGVARIDHGNRALEDEDLVRRLVRDGTPLTVCPLSNLRLGVVPDLRQHPLRDMLRLGLRATVNSDDPAYFGGYLNENFHALIDAIGLRRGEILQLVKNAFRAAFLPGDQVLEHLAAVEAAAGEAV